MSDSALYRSSDTRLGLLLVLVVVAGAVAAWVLSRPRAEGPVLTVEYPQVFGLTEGDPVLLNGLQVGAVEAIETEFLDLGAVRILVSMRLSPDLMGPEGDSLRMTRGTEAHIVPAALPFLGRTQIRLVPDATGGARLRDGDRLAGGVDASLLDALSAQADRVVGSVEDVTGQLAVLIDSIQATRRETDRTLRMVRTEVPAMTGAMRERFAAIDELLATANAEIGETGPSVRLLLDSLTMLTSDARALVDDVDRSVASRLPDIDLILARLDSTSFVANHLVMKISEQPLRVLWGVGVPDSIPTRRGGR